MSEALSRLLADTHGAANTRLVVLFRALGVPGLLPALLLEALSPFARIGARSLLEGATPFFWLNVQRLHDGLRTESDAGALKEAPCVRWLLMTAFDSFYEQLPDGTAVRLPSAGPSAVDSVVLPKLRVHSPPLQGDLSLHRLGPARLAIEAVGRVVPVDLDESASRISCAPIADVPSAWLLGARHPALFEEAYYESILPDGQCCTSFAKHIGEALALVGAADPELSARIRCLIKWYVPVRSPDRATHCSFSSPQLPGVMFLSETDDALRLGEAIVHELGHAELDQLLSTEDLFIADETELFYSPWRLDARPLMGLFHGCYVFAEVLRLLLRLSQTRTTQTRTARELSERAILVTHRLRLGVAQIRVERLTPAGRLLLDEIDELARRAARELGIEGAGLPPVAQSHLDRWLREHPELAPRVVIPGVASPLDFHRGLT